MLTTTSFDFSGDYEDIGLSRIENRQRMPPVEESWLPKCHFKVWFKEKVTSLVGQLTNTDLLCGDKVPVILSPLYSKVLTDEVS